ncbi:MAG TPA: VanW family protein [Polyangiaceae bacterium]|nr:VanW family protein [Polyangiaceae bacterium]
MALLFVGIGVFGALGAVQGDAIAKGVRVNEVAVGGMTREQAASALAARVAAFRLTYAFAGTKTQIDPDSDRARPVASYDLDGALKGALDVGRDVNALRALAERLNAGMFGSTVVLPYKLDRNALRALLEQKFKSGAKAARDAHFIISIDGSGSPTVTVAAAEEGMTVDYDAVVAATDQRLREFSDDVVNVPVKKDKPEVLQKDLEPLVPRVREALSRGPLTLTAKGETWTVSVRTLADWLAGVRAADAGGTVSLGLDRDKVETYLAARATSIATPAKNAVFEEKDGKVTVFEPGIDGDTLDINGSLRLLEHALFGEPAPTGESLELPIVAVPPAITTEAANPYGIKEIIGIGSTNFMGSPKNRRHNIAVGAASVDGSLIGPGETFSLLKVLGKIDGTTGYLQELVIKENKTKPEYGGGLCQIGSTTFRAVLASGLPVVERRNHSYRVPYYERDGDGSTIGPGKDATIYDPSPDFKFLNDTGHHILIKTAIEGNKLSFIFWGVSDGRKSEQTKARVYNIVPPPEKKVVETEDLKPGEEKCTEHAHVGSDAVFTYTVTYADGTVKKEDIHSHYKPWQEVCLVGKDPNAPPAGSGTPDDGVPSSDAAGATGN